MAGAAQQPQLFLKIVVARASRVYGPALDGLQQRAQAGNARSEVGCQTAIQAEAGQPQIMEVRLKYRNADLPSALDQGCANAGLSQAFAYAIHLRAAQMRGGDRAERATRVAEAVASDCVALDHFQQCRQYRLQKVVARGQAVRACLEDGEIVG